MIHLCALWHARSAHTEWLVESKCHLAPTFSRQGSQPLTWAQARCSCLAECPLCPFGVITHAASRLWISRTLLPSHPSSAQAPLAVLVCKNTGRHTWGDTPHIWERFSHRFCERAIICRLVFFIFFTGLWVSLFFVFMSCFCDSTCH